MNDENQGKKASGEEDTNILRRPDYSVLDRPEFLEVAFYPRRFWTPAPSNAIDSMIEVDTNVCVSTRFYPAPTGSPVVLYFHGNGEIACQYDDISRVYNQIGIGLFVADYRGYGHSGGMPSFSTMVSDTKPIFKTFEEVVRSSSPDSKLFVMGRSMGSISAAEIAYRYPGQLDGLIIDSGFANAALFARRLGFKSESIDTLSENVSERIRAINIPALVIHGQKDSLIPVEVGRRLYEELGSKDKDLFVIEGAEHNDIISVGMRQYFPTIKDFVFRQS